LRPPARDPRPGFEFHCLSMPALTPNAWAFFSGFGGAAVMLPLALALACWLWFAFPWRVPALWLALLGGACALVACTKVAFLGWGLGILSIDFTGVSGHTMLSCAVLPVLLYVTLLPAPRAFRTAGLCLGLALGAMVGLSRVALQAHSVSEIVAGCALGAAVALVFLDTLREREPMRAAPVLAPLSLVLLTASLHGLRVPTQHWVTEVALTLSGHERPYIRARWKAARPHDKTGLNDAARERPLPVAALSPPVHTAVL
jgi:hypothetical protein